MKSSAPCTSRNRELTVRAAVLGVGLSALLSAANAYLGLFAGMTVSASIPAAVLSMAVLRALRGGMLENNLVQTAASAGESAAAGAIFTLPALALLGSVTRFDYWTTSLLIGSGGVLGVLFTIPLRRALVEPGDLPFPEGVATAEVLRTGHGLQASEAPSVKGGTRLLVAGASYGAMTKLFESGLSLSRGTIEGALWVRSGAVYLGVGLSPALAAVGAIIGLPVALLMLAGGLLNWLFAVPLVVDPSQGNSALDAAWSAWSTKTRYLGVGAMSVGGLWTLIELRGALLAAVRSGHQALRGQGDGRDLARPALFALLLLASALVAGLLYWLSRSIPMTLLLLTVVLVLGFLFCAVAAYMAGLVGSSNNPVSGVTIATILLTSLLLLAVGFNREALPSVGVTAPAAAILVGSMVCTAAAIGGDNMQDLKAGHVLGATPAHQQIVQLLGVVSAALVMAPVLNLLLEAYGFGPSTPEHPHALRAPQATLMASVAKGVFGGLLPWTFVTWGGGLGIATVALDRWLLRRGARFRVPVLAVAVGIYLPLALTLPMVLGAWVVSGGKGEKGRKGRLLTAAGLITGEALLGIGWAAVVGMRGAGGFGIQEGLDSGLLGVLLFSVALLLLRGSSRPAE